MKICLVRRAQQQGSCAGTGPGLRFIYQIIETSCKVFKTDQNCIPLALSSSPLSLPLAAVSWFTCRMPPLRNIPAKTEAFEAFPQGASNLSVSSHKAHITIP